MLAGKAPEDLSTLKFPLLASPKLDGVRVVIRDCVVYSRNMKPIPNERVQWLFGIAELGGLDGELIVGDPRSPTAFRDTSSGVMSRAGTPDVRLFAFDYVAVTLSFRQRLDIVAKRASKYKNVKLVPQLLVKDVNALVSLEEHWLSEGYEGAMLRDPGGLYKHGRSTTREGWLLKLKRFSDSEAIVEGYEEKMHNANEATVDALGRTKRSAHKAGKQATGVLGALCVRDIHTGAQFNVGTGFSDEERERLWELRDMLVGAIVSYKFFPSGSKDKPRFPTFRGFRNRIDL